MRRRVFKEDNWNWDFLVTSEHYSIYITGGSVKIYDRVTKVPLKIFSGYQYLYTGDVSPDEKELVALENGKHFYVYSLDDLEQRLRVTLPRGYEAIDVYPFYSEDGNVLYVPVQRYIYTDKEKERGYFEFSVCKYDVTKKYTLINTEKKDRKLYRWDQLDHPDFNPLNMIETLLPKFEHVTKGSLRVTELDIEWTLGELRFVFQDDCDRQSDGKYLVMVLSERDEWEEIQHLHLSEEELIDFIQNLDDPLKSYCIEMSLGGFFVKSSFVDKCKMQKITKRRYYSD